MIREYPCRISGAIGLPTIKLLSSDREKAFDYMLAHNLELMLGAAYASIDKVVNLDHGAQS